MAEPVQLAIAGDVMLGRLVNETIRRRGGLHVWGDLLPVLRAADLVLVNLECALTAVTELWHAGDYYKAFYFRSEPSHVSALQAAGVGFASLANNHVLDFGPAGLQETIRVLDEAGIAHAGAGMDLAAARRPARLEAGGFRVAVVAFADHPQAWAAGPTTPGISYTPVSADPEDFAVIEASLREARDGADFVIFCIHWGPNMRLRPTAPFRAFARGVIDAGADLFWGHSAHVVQGIELHAGKPILYDTGDFVDDYAVDPDLRNDLSALFLLSIRDRRLERLELLPVAIGETQVNRAHGSDRDWFVRRFRGLCAEFGIEPDTEMGRILVRPGGADTQGGDC